MKVVILAGGYGTRLSEYTSNIPKPMLEIGGIPMIEHIMNHYDFYGFREFIICLGYKQNIIKNYFFNFNYTNNDICINTKNNEVDFLNKPKKEWKINLVDTGIDTKTGGRLKRIKKFLKNETFLLTYGDGLSNINLLKKIKFHQKQNKALTMSAVRPQARFGELEIENGSIKSFQEKPQLKQGRINGGFFVVEPRFIDYIDGDEDMLEKNPMQKAILNNDVAAYETDEFWRCVDSKRDLEFVQGLWDGGQAKWRH
tara:strand:+ start:17056 stop:17820 length:765 start_codon:yes stop_codon:yes gene_type:complete